MLRLAVLPVFLYFFSIGVTTLCLLVFVLAAGTDLIDGYVARKLKVSSKIGAYFDVATDFTFITGVFIVFTLSNYYSAWMLLFIVSSFIQFIVSSFFAKKLYDPLGKYLGSVLYLAIAVTLVFPILVVFIMVEVGFIVFALTSFVTRTVSLVSMHKKTLMINLKVTIKHHKTQNTN